MPAGFASINSDLERFYFRVRGGHVSRLIKMRPQTLEARWKGRLRIFSRVEFLDSRWPAVSGAFSDTHTPLHVKYTPLWRGAVPFTNDWSIIPRTISGGRWRAAVRVLMEFCNGNDPSEKTARNTRGRRLNLLEICRICGDGLSGEKSWIKRR